MAYFPAETHEDDPDWLLGIIPEPKQHPFAHTTGVLVVVVLGLIVAGVIVVEVLHIVVALLAHGFNSQ